MKVIKCIGCKELRQERITVKDELLTIYNCEHHFPYSTVISGLLYPGKGIREAAEKCPVRIEEHCILCNSTETLTLGGDMVDICLSHDRAWEKWLSDHPAKRHYLRPRGQRVKRNWIEVFREFVESAREIKGGKAW